jgi:hypothetical protein
MARIFNGVDGIGKPTLDDWQTYDERAKEYLDKIIVFAKAHGSSDYSGKVIHFGIADGNACYVVLSLKPIRLIHIDTFDGYTFPYVTRLTAKDIKEKIEQQEALERIFSK